MAEKTEDLETDTFIAAKEIELKKELQRVVKSILEEDDYGIETIVEAMKILGSLRELKFKKKPEASFEVDDNIVVPEKFRCPLSKEIMSDPVILATGQTYDRPSTERSLNEGNKTRPQTRQVPTHIVLTPNHLVRDMISHWCKKHGIKLPKPAYHIDEEVITVADRDYFNSLLKMMASYSHSDQDKAVKELRLLTKQIPFFRALFGESDDVITRFLTPLSIVRARTEHDFQEDLITTVLNISIHENNKKPVAKDPFGISVLIDALDYGEYRTSETRRNAAAALFTLSVLDSNKLIITETDALKLLIELLDEGNASAMKEAASAIINLCTILENKETAVSKGAVQIILKKIMEREFVDELLAILAILSGHQEGVYQMVEAVPCLLSIVKESTCERNKENSVAILYDICCHDMTKLREIKEEENASGTLSKLVQSGTSRAKREAIRILEKLNRAASRSHTA